MGESRERQRRRWTLGVNLSRDVTTTQSDLRHNRPVQQYLFVQNTTNVTGSNIENLFPSQNNQGATSPSGVAERTTYNQNMIGEERPEDCTWLSSKVVLFNKRIVSGQPNSKVYHGRQELFNGSYRDVAIKLIQYSRKNMTEIDNLLKLNHPNIVQIYEAGEYRGAVHWIYMVMELCAMNLEEYVDENTSDPSKAYRFFKQIIGAVRFMHERNIAHRDIKPSNILISRCGDVVKFSDFGISKEIPHGLTSVTDTSQGAGSEGYKPPEAYHEDYKVSLKSDIFSLGIVLAYLFSHGKHPFGDNPFDWGYKIRNNVEFDLSQILTGMPKRQKLSRLLAAMLSHQQRGRPTIHQIKDQFHNDTDDNTADARDVKADVETDSASLLKLKQMSIDGRSTIVLFDNKTKHLYRFNYKNYSMIKMRQFHPSDATLSREFSATSVGEYILLFVADRSVYRLNCCDVMATWEKMSNWLPFHGAGTLPVVASSNAIFSVSAGALRASRSVYKYNPWTDQWVELHGKPTATCGSAIVCTDQFLYSIGGFDERSNWSNVVERMNLATSRWETIAKMNQTRPSVVYAAECGDDIYVVGARFGMLDLEKYDPSVAQWTQIEPFAYNGYWNLRGVIGMDSNLFAFSENRIAIYSIKWNSWRIVNLCNGEEIYQAVMVKCVPVHHS